MQLSLLLTATKLNLSDRSPEFNALGADLGLVLLCHCTRHLHQSLDVGSEFVVLLAADLDQALHGGLSDRGIGRLQSLVKDPLHDEVSLLGNFEVLCRVWNRVVQGLDSESAAFLVGGILADVLSQGRHDLVFQLLGQVFGLELLADVANSDE